MKNAPLETKRLLFRRMTEDDWEEVAAMLQDERVMAAWEHAFTDDEVTEWIQKQERCYLEDKLGYLLAVEKATGRVVGQMGLHLCIVNQEQVVEVCYMLKHDCFGQGFAFEGAKALIAYAKHSLGVDSVYALIKYNNFPSIAVAERLGMKKIGSLMKVYRGKEMEHGIYVIS